MSQDYAVIKTGGKQYRVREGDQIDVEKINAEIGSDVIFENVLVMCDGKDILESRNTCSNLLTVFTNTFNE